MYYNELKEKITAHAGKECADFAAKITTATVGDVLASWYLKQYTTPATLAALQELPAGDPIPETIKNRMQTKRARVAAERVATYGSASGCGYDKQSAAIASAMNQNPEILKILYDHAEAGGTFPYGVHTFAGLPSFDGGCGVSCFYSIFEACGYTFRQVASGKAFDVYEITRAKK